VELEETKEKLTTYVDLQLGPGIEQGMLSQDARNLGLGLLIYIKGVGCALIFFTTILHVLPLLLLF